MWECTIHCWAAATPLSTYSKRKSCESTLSTYIPWMASFIIMSVQSQTFNVLKNQVWLFLHFFFCNTVASCDLNLLCKDWDGLPCALVLNKFLTNLATFGVEMSQVFGKGSHLFMPQSLVTIVLSCLFRTSIQPFAAGGVCKKFFPYLWSSASSALSFSEGIEHSFGTSILGQLVDGSNSVTWASLKSEIKGT